MKTWNFSSIRRLAPINHWINQSALQKLAVAYSATIAIKEIEDKHFNGKSISPENGKGKIITDYFQVQLNRELAKVKFNLAQFKLGSAWFKPEASGQETEISETEALILEKLSFIESVVSKYRQPDNLDSREAEQIEDVPVPTATTLPIKL